MTTPQPHVGGPIDDGSLNVTANSLAVARKGDPATCVPSKDTIKRGSLTVRVNGRLFARQDDQSVHKGKIAAGSLNVVVGSVPAACAYLDFPYTVEAPLKDFDANRGTSTVGPKQSGNHTFRGDTSPSAADIYDVNVNGQVVKVIAPSAGAPANKYLPTVDQIAKSLAVVPSAQLATIKQVVLNPNQNPDDATWATTYNTPGFTSLATGGDGGVTYYPRTSPYTQELLDSSSIHEGGHTYSQELWKDPNVKAEWENAIKADDLAPSQYSENAPTEDFSESLVVYSLAKGTPCEAIARANFPNRYAALDKLFAPKSTP